MRFPVYSLDVHRRRFRKGSGLRLIFPGEAGGLAVRRPVYSMDVHRRRFRVGQGLRLLWPREAVPHIVLTQDVAVEDVSRLCSHRGGIAEAQRPTGRATDESGVRSVGA